MNQFSVSRSWVETENRHNLMALSASHCRPGPLGTRPHQSSMRDYKPFLGGTFTSCSSPTKHGKSWSSVKTWMAGSTQIVPLPYSLASHRLLP